MTERLMTIIAIIIGIIVIVALIKGRRVAAQIGSMHLELSENGSRSVKDRVDLIYNLVKDMPDELKDVRARLDVIERRKPLR